jgi:molybdenum cofactor biosynthesis protein B
MADQIPDGTHTHRSEGDQRPPVACAIVTVSDSRTEATDASGARMRELLEDAGHRVVDYALLKNDETGVREHVRALVARDDVDVVLVTGGTGLGSRDRTVEAVRPLLEQVGTAAILSRAVAGSVRGRLVVSMPGSKAAVELALTRVLLPELRHAIRELRR